MIINCWGQPFNTDDAADLTRLLAFLDTHPHLQKRNGEYMINHLVFLFDGSKTLSAANQMKNVILSKHDPASPIHAYKSKNQPVFIAWSAFDKYFMHSMHGPLAVYYKSHIYRDGMGVRVGSQYVIDHATQRNADPNLDTLREVYDAARERGELDLVDDITEDDGSGYIYVITSPLYPYVKLGRHRGSMERLRNRYIGLLGPDIQLVVKEVADRVASERLLLHHFTHANVVNEIFEKTALDQIVEYMS